MHQIAKPNGAKLVTICGDGICQAVDLCRYAQGNLRETTIRRVERGERLHAVRNGVMKLQIVRNGLVATSAMTPDGRRQILYLSVAGDPVCAMFADASECWCEALAPSEICELDLHAHAEILRQNPRFAEIMMRRMHERLERTATHVMALGRLDGLERICMLLADMTRRTGRRKDGVWYLRLTMSREDIADYLGLNTDTVSRLLTRIRQAKLAHFVSRYDCEIPSLERLVAQVPITIGVGVPSVERSSRAFAS